MEPLNEVERRVLGALIEKKLAQPQYYPLTLNALVAACNQKSNRDPLMDLDEATVFDTVEALRERQLVSRVLAGAGSRTDRFRTDAAQTLGWGAPAQAVMAELLLRGPQTVGELRTRCGRMHHFESTEEVSATLQRLAEDEPTFVVQMPRAAGQSAVRFRHTLYWPEEAAGFEQGIERANPVAPAARAATGGMAAELAALREELQALRERVERLEERG
jgi:uncharacterized protein